MGFVVQYGPNPETLGAYSFSGAASKATRENLQRSLDNAQQAAQFNAQLRQHATDRAVNQYDRQQGRAADLQQVAMQQAGYERKNQFELQQAQEKNAALIQQEQMQQQGMRAQKYDEMVQAGLKDGTLFHTPQQKQQMAELQRSIGEIYADTSIAPEQQDAMADRQYKRMRGIVPAVRSQEDVPVPLTGRLAESTAIWTADGRMIPGSERSPQPGEWIGTQVTRNGSQQTKWEQVPPIKDTGDNWSSQKFIAQQREIIRNGLVNQRNSEYDRELRTWEAKQKHYSDGLDRDGPSTSAPPPGPMPSMQKVEDWEVDAKLHAISGGTVMPTIQPPQPPQQVPVAPQPGRVMWPGERQAIEGVRAGSLSPGAPFANDPGRSPPVVVNSEAEALRQPPGTTVILNGRKFLVGE